MKVFSVKADGDYAAGMAIVAAVSKQEALTEAATIDNRVGKIDWLHGDVSLLDCVDFDGNKQILIYCEYTE